MYFGRGMYFQHMIVKSRFFESVDSYVHQRDWEQLAARKLGPRWSLRRWSFWLQATPDDANTPLQGFKLHISPDLSRLNEQVTTVFDVLSTHRAMFKFVADRHLLEVTNSKNFARTASAKFFTVYPRDHAQFMTLTSALRDALQEYDGPYILTDRRVPGSRVVFYRYGGLANVKSNGADGALIYMISTPDGILVEDKREPRFQLPEWVSDPFVHEPDPDDESPYLNGRFEVESAIYFSNSGGIYKAKDHETGETVVLKEARPYAGWRSANGQCITAPEAVTREYEVLNLLAPLGIAPKPYDLFKQWEHTFLAEEYLEWPTWMQFFTREEVFLGPFMRGTCSVIPFLKALVPVILNAIELIRSGHECGVIFGDLSPSNLMIDSETQQVKIIDVESVVSASQPCSWQTYWATQGFGSPERDRRGHLALSDDWYALGKCVVSAIMPLQGLTVLGTISDLELARRLVFESGLPWEVLDLIEALLAADIDRARTIIEELAKKLEKPYRELRLQADPLRVSRPEPCRLVDDAGSLEHMADFIAHAYRGLERTEIWPGDPAIYLTSKWNIAFGATGIVSFLEAIGRAGPDELCRTLGDVALSRQVGDIGLYTGLSGIAAYHCAKGRYRLAEAFLGEVARSHLRYRATGIQAGEAGVGIAALSLYHASGLGSALDLAADCARYLASNAQDDLAGAFWITSVKTEQVHFGYLRGVTGIAYFLASYALAADCARSLVLSERAIAYVLRQALTDSKGRMQWGMHGKDMRQLPYWSDGAAGMGSVLLRIGLQTSRQDYVSLACDLAESAFSKLTVNAGQFDGLAGIAEFLNDLYLVTRNLRYRHLLAEVLGGISLFATPSDDGLAFPGALSMRLSCDFATGSAGIGLAIQRARHGGSRPFMDFNLPSGALFAAAEDAM